jgi:hypothetical protein
MIPILNDESPMPLGKYRGRKMADVPADYLLWYGQQPELTQVHNSVKANDRAIREYIKDNRDALLAEQKRAKRNYMFNPYQ